MPEDMAVGDIPFIFMTFVAIAPKVQLSIVMLFAADTSMILVGI